MFNPRFKVIARPDPCLSGKTLGGTSAINGGAWTRGLDAQYDSWSALLEKSEADVGWNWQGLFGYMKKASKFPSFRYPLDLPPPRPKRSHPLPRSRKLKVPNMLPPTMAPLVPLVLLTRTTCLVVLSKAPFLTPSRQLLGSSVLKT